MAILCTVGHVLEILLLITLSGILLIFAVFSNLLEWTISFTNPVFIFFLRQIGKIISYLINLTVMQTWSALGSICNFQLNLPVNIDQSVMSIASAPSEEVDTTP